MLLRKGQLPQVHYGDQDLAQCNKNFYDPYPSLAQMPKSEIESLRLEHNIEVEGATDFAPAPAPVERLDLAQFPDETVRALKDQSIFLPTPIQMQAHSAERMAELAIKGVTKVVKTLLS